MFEVMTLKCEKLEVWQRSKTICVEIYLATQSLRDYGYRDQLTRAGLSIPSNIAEGLERRSDKEKVRFLDFARASAAEVKTQMMVGSEINYLDSLQVIAWINELEIIGKMISSLINSIQRQAR